MDHTVLFLFGSGCACLGFSARWVAVTIEERITARRELQATCDHVWGQTQFNGPYPYRHCKWCKKQQNYHGTKDQGEWRDV